MYLKYMNFFFKHPSNVCMTYMEHLRFSLNISFLLGIGTFKALIHSFIPDLFIDSTTNLIKLIDYKLKNSGCRENKL